MSYLRVLLVVSAFLAAVVKPQSTSGTSAADLEVAVFKTCQDEPILNISWDTPSGTCHSNTLSLRPSSTAVLLILVYRQ